MWQRLLADRCTQSTRVSRAVAVLAHVTLSAVRSLIAISSSIRRTTDSSSTRQIPGVQASAACVNSNACASQQRLPAGRILVAAGQMHDSCPAERFSSSIAAPQPGTGEPCILWAIRGPPRRVWQLEHVPALGSCSGRESTAAMHVAWMRGPVVVAADMQCAGLQYKPYMFLLVDANQHIAR